MDRFSDIKLGDQVVIGARSAWSDRRRVATVERVTATQFVAGGIRFTKNGYEVGGDTYHRGHARIATDQLIAEVEAEQAFNAAIGKLRRLENMIQTRRLEICRQPRPLQLMANIENALLHLQSALDALNAQQGGSLLELINDSNEVPA
jgi:hypothetical protein